MHWSRFGAVCVTVACVSGATACKLPHDRIPIDVGTRDAVLDSISDTMGDGFERVDIVPMDADAGPDVDVIDASDAFDAIDAIDVTDVPDAPDASPILFNVDFTVMPPGGTNLSSTHLGFSRASTATVQTSAEAVVSGIAADTARIGDDGRHSGLVLEEARTNLLVSNRDLSAAGWSRPTSGITEAFAFAAGPDGTAATATRLTSTSINAQSSSQSPSLSTPGPVVGSEWVRAVGSSAAYQLCIEWVGVEPVFGTCTGSWQRVSGTYQEAMRAQYQFVALETFDRTAFGGGQPHPTDLVVDLPQLEGGRFATEVIPTQATPATRAGERLFALSAAELLDPSSGRLSIEFIVQPKGARAQYDNPIRLWTLDATNYAELAPTTDVLTVVVAGSPNAFAGLDWMAGDTVDFFLAVGGGTPAIARMRINGGSATTLATTGSPLPAIHAAGPIDLLCNGSSNQWSSWVRSITAYRDGVVPF